MTLGRASLLCLAIPLLACSGLSKLDYTKLASRAGWQHPDRVVESLEIRPGSRVADIGAGDGYFIPYLADAVGPEGTVYAVEVDPEKVEALETRVREEGRRNVVVVSGEFADPLLPDAGVDLVFLVNTYHHIEDRPAYFSRLKADLREPGRVAIIDMRDDLTGILRLFATDGHWTRLESMREEMEQAGYRPAASFEFLPVQSFEVFEPGG
jgi:ubiquinone/menaquinone biosynthesis C-methylase UbiE